MKNHTNILYRDKYLRLAELPSLHQDSRNWIRENAFYKEELDFLKKLIDRNFIHLMQDEGLLAAVNISNKIEKIKNLDLANLEALIQIHERRLQILMKEDDYHEEKRFRQEHRRLELKMHDFRSKYFLLKRYDPRSALFSVQIFMLKTPKNDHVFNKQYNCCNA